LTIARGSAPVAGRSGRGGRQRNDRVPGRGGARTGRRGTPAHPRLRDRGRPTVRVLRPVLVPRPVGVCALRVPGPIALLRRDIPAPARAILGTTVREPWVLVEGSSAPVRGVASPGA